MMRLSQNMVHVQPKSKYFIINLSYKIHGFFKINLVIKVATMCERHKVHSDTCSLDTFIGAKSVIAQMYFLKVKLYCQSTKAFTKRNLISFYSIICTYANQL